MVDPSSGNYTHKNSAVESVKKAHSIKCELVRDVIESICKNTYVVFEIMKEQVTIFVPEEMPQVEI